MVACMGGPHALVRACVRVRAPAPVGVAAADVVREEFGVAWLKLRLSKPGALRGSRDVGVIIERGERT